MDCRVRYIDCAGCCVNFWSVAGKTNSFRPGSLLCLNKNKLMNKQLICPLCSDRVDKLLYHFHLDSERAV